MHLSTAVIAEDRSVNIHRLILNVQDIFDALNMKQQSDWLLP